MFADWFTDFISIAFRRVNKIDNAIAGQQKKVSVKGEASIGIN